ncbi:hypothetical protein [Salinigranum salinum]|uniref:hypothetical protein n=1 Tax=Salinigranum salinum TaxID=1364937 RepID=UPI0018643D0C|nr:hypothetical protein [Salinigranum salinum]
MNGRIGVVVLVIAVVVAATSMPAAGAATGIEDSAIAPGTVPTGESTALSFTTAVTGVDATDGTTGGTVTFAVADGVDLSGATVTRVAVAPNASDDAASVDADAGTVTVAWDDDGGVTGETLSIRVDVAGVVVERTGETSVSARVDADATGGSDLTATVGTVTARATASDRSVGGDRATLYLGERAVDVTGVGGASPAGTGQQFYGVAGEAEGTFATADDTRSVDVTAANGFVTGSYALSSDTEEPRVTVRRPRVTDITLSPGSSTSGADVTNGSVPHDVDRLTAAVAFTFDDAENVTLSVEDEDGLDVTDQLTDAPVVSASDGSVTLDVSSLDVGRYEVTAEGADDLETASRTVSIRIRDPAPAITLSQTRLTRGDSTVVSVAGSPGDVRYVRVDGSALRADATVTVPTARALFDDTEQVQTIGADADADTLYAVVSLDDDGLANLRLQTDRLAADLVDVELAPELDATAEDDVTLDVTERTLSVATPSTTVVGETVTVSGTAPESDRVKLYAAVGEAYVPLYADADAGTLAEADVGGDGAWTTDVDTGSVVDLPGTYRVVAVADPGTARLGSTASIADDAVRSLDPRDSTTLTTVEGRLTLGASRTTIAATGSDEFSLSGAAVGGDDDLRLYHVEPRGNVSARTVDASGGVVETTIDGLETRGTHTFVVVGAGRDGTYAYADGSGPSVDGLVSGRETRSAALAKLVDAYAGAGSDDPIVRVNVTAVEPTVGITTPSGDGPITPSRVDLAGRSASEDGTTVFVELLGSDGTAARSTEATVTNGTWNVTLDLSGVSPGTYRLTADTAEASDSVAVAVVSRTATPSSRTPTASEPTTGDESDPGRDSTPSEASTPTSTSTSASPATDAATTSTRFPGFGPVVAGCALALVVVALSRRARWSR